MKNRLLSMTRESIPYIKQLRPLAKSVTGCVIMQQLDYWFARFPDGFFKFLEPCANKRYKEGKSWCEEIGCSAEEFTTAFEHLGVRYKSKTAYETSADKFQGKLYCSYFDRGEGLTYYFRNHDLVDRKLDELLRRETDPAGLPETGSLGFPETGRVGARKPASSVYVNRQSRGPETGDVGLLNKASEIKEETTGREHTHEVSGLREREGATGRVCVPEGVTIYSLSQRREYATAHPLSITDPERWVHSRRTCAGEFDEAIREWYAKGGPVEGSAATSKPADTSACPDCEGKGYYFTNPTDPKTHTRCTHPRLAEGLAQLRQQYDDAQAELAGASRS